MNSFDIFIILLACGLSGYAIGEIGKDLGLPLWVRMLVAGVFGWFLGGTL